MSSIQPKKYVLLSGVTATTTSNGAPINNAGRASIQIQASNITLGSATFTFEVSNDGLNYLTYNRMTSNVTNTNAQTDARIASVLLNTSSGSMLFIPPGDTFNFIRVKATVNNSTDGNYTATLYAN